jgi:pyruvate dehydrogenase E1 component alpha subunit/2-oxoisovalerate dehydrogenase E1 component alpha subunit
MTSKQVETWREECRSAVEQAMAQAAKEPGPDPYKESWRAISSTSLIEGQWET